MNGAQVLDIGRDAIWLTIQLAAPMLIVGLVVGVVVGLIQTLTQIQEQTLTFVPKVIVVLLLIAFTSPWIVSMFVDFTIALWGNIPNMVR